MMESDGRPIQGLRSRKGFRVSLDKGRTQTGSKAAPSGHIEANEEEATVFS